MLKRLAFLMLVGYGAWHYWHVRPVNHPPGMTVAADPQQSDIENSTPFSLKGYRLTPLARFRVKARVLGAERYRLGRESELSPVDLALGWGPMSDSTVLERLRISQGNRFYYYAWENNPPIAPQDIVTHSANMHMIPADAMIERRLEAVRPGDIVAFQGQLVAIEASDGWRWRSSMTRSDTGSGACEVVWVSDLQVQ
jgi:hypothetical protein